MRGVLVRPARPGDGDELAPRLRPSDAFEVAAVGGDLASVEAGVRASRPCWAAELDGRVEGLWGVGRPPGLPPTAWLLQSGALTARHLARHVPVWLPRMLREAGQDLWNVVPAGSLAEAWLERLGALVNREFPHRFAGHRFHAFVLPLEILDRV